MAAVQAQVLSHYRSNLVERIRANGHVLSSGDLTIKLAKEFGFCYGVERAIDLAYAEWRGESSPNNPRAHGKTVAWLAWKNPPLSFALRCHWWQLIRAMSEENWWCIPHG